MDRDKQNLKKVLDRGGYFMTRPRLRLFRVLQAGGAMTTRQIIEKMPRYNQATIYRTISLFEDLGIIKRVQLGWNSRLELTDDFQHHHHHLTCLKCDRVINVPEDTLLESEIARLSYRSNFKAVDHQLEIRGLCSDCQ